MSLASETLNKQKQSAFAYILRGALLTGIGMFAGVMVLKNGIGTAPSRDRGPAAWLYQFLSSQMEKGENAEKFVTVCFAAFFFLLGAIGCYHLIRGIWKMGSSHTILGKSIICQSESHENFSDVVASIDVDMNQEPAVFGNVSVGRKWILDREVMRLSNIRGVFWFNEGMENYMLCCVDDKENIWSCSLRYEDQRDKAAAYLNKMIPDAITGNKEACTAYLRRELSENVQDTEK